MGTAARTLSSLCETQNEIHTHRSLGLSSANLDGRKSSLVVQSWELKHELAAVSEG